MTRVGIIGSGDVGQRLGAAFIETGYEVRIGSREPNGDALTRWRSENGAAASTGSPEDAAKFGELIVFATAWSGAESAVELAVPANFAGKTVIDTTNPLVYHENAMPTFSVGLTDSAGEQLQRWLPDAHVVKAFNSVGNAHFFRPQLESGPPTMFYCGDDPAAKATVRRILESFGWEPLDVGPLESARFVEPLCLLWVKILFQNGSPDHAFKVLRPGRTNASPATPHA